MTPSEAARTLRAIPSEKRARASRENGKKGGRPREWNAGSFSARGRRGFVILYRDGRCLGYARDAKELGEIATDITDRQTRNAFIGWANEAMHPGEPPNARRVREMGAQITAMYGGFNAKNVMVVEELYQQMRAILGKEIGAFSAVRGACIRYSTATGKPLSQVLEGALRALQTGTDPFDLRDSLMEAAGGRIIISMYGDAWSMEGARRLAEHIPDEKTRERFLTWAEDILKAEGV